MGSFRPKLTEVREPRGREGGAESTPLGGNSLATPEDLAPSRIPDSWSISRTRERVTLKCGAGPIPRTGSPIEQFQSYTEPTIEGLQGERAWPTCSLEWSIISISPLITFHVSQQQTPLLSFKILGSDFLGSTDRIAIVEFVPSFWLLVLKGNFSRGFPSGKTTCRNHLSSSQEMSHQSVMKQRLILFYYSKLV